MLHAETTKFTPPHRGAAEGNDHEEFDSNLMYSMRFIITYGMKLQIFYGMKERQSERVDEWMVIRVYIVVAVRCVNLLSSSVHIWWFWLVRIV